MSESEAFPTKEAVRIKFEQWRKKAMQFQALLKAKVDIESEISRCQTLMNSDAAELAKAIRGRCDYRTKEAKMIFDISPTSAFVVTALTHDRVHCEIVENATKD